MTIPQLNFNRRKLIFFFTARLDTLDALLSRKLADFKATSNVASWYFSRYARRNDNVPFFLE